MFMLIFKIMCLVTWVYANGVDVLLIGYFLTSSEMVAHVITSKNDQFIDPVVPLDVFQWLKKKLFLFCLPTVLYLPFFAQET